MQGFILFLEYGSNYFNSLMSDLKAITHIIINNNLTTCVYVLGKIWLYWQCIEGHRLGYTYSKPKKWYWSRVCTRHRCCIDSTCTTFARALVKNTTLTVNKINVKKIVYIKQKRINKTIMERIALHGLHGVMVLNATFFLSFVLT